MLGSRRILTLVAEDLEQVHREYVPEANRMQVGELLWHTTQDAGQRPSDGKKTEDDAVHTVIFPVVTQEGVDRRTAYKKGDRKSHDKHLEARDIEMMVRLRKSAQEHGGWLSGAEVSVLMNRRVTTIGTYLKAYCEKTGEVWAMKGDVVDHGRNPTHNGVILALYEQGISPADIVLTTGHRQSAVDNSITTYEHVLHRVRKKHDAVSMTQILGRRMNTVRQYLLLVKNVHPGLEVEVPQKQISRQDVQNR